MDEPKINKKKENASVHMLATGVNHMTITWKCHSLGYFSRIYFG